MSNFSKKKITAKVINVDTIEKILVRTLRNLAGFPKGIYYLEKVNLMHHMSIVKSNTSKGMKAYMRPIWS